MFNNLHIFSPFLAKDQVCYCEIAIFQEFLTPIPNYLDTDLEKMKISFYGKTQI